MNGKMIKRICRKLWAKRGDSIAEVLIALLVSSAGLLVLATMLSGAKKMVTESRETIYQYVDAENEIAAQDDDTHTISDNQGKITIYDSATSSAMILTDSSDIADPAIDVTYQVNSSHTIQDRYPIVSYKKR